MATVACPAMRVGTVQVMPVPTGRKRARNPSTRGGGLVPFRRLDATLAAPKVYWTSGTELAAYEKLGITPDELGSLPN